VHLLFYTGACDERVNAFGAHKVPVSFFMEPSPSSPIPPQTGACPPEGSDGHAHEQREDDGPGRLYPALLEQWEHCQVPRVPVLAQQVLELGVLRLGGQGLW